MCLILTDYQSKTSIYNNGSTYMNLMVTIQQKLKIDMYTHIHTRNPRTLQKKIIESQERNKNKK